MASNLSQATTDVNRLHELVAFFNQICLGGASEDATLDNQTRPVLAKLAASFLLGMDTYATVAEGLAGAGEGGFFQVVSDVDEEYTILYQDVNGVAIEKKRYPSYALHQLVLEARDRAEAAAQSAETSSDVASTARDQSVAASEASGDVQFFDTKSDADAAALAEGDIVEVFADESRGGGVARYRYESGSLVFKWQPGQRHVQAAGSADTRTQQEWAALLLQPNSSEVTAQDTVDKRTLAEWMAFLLNPNDASIDTATGRQTIVGALDSRTISVESIASLRGQSFGNSVTFARLAGYLAGYSDGGGILFADRSDTTSPDNGGTVFVDSAGVRWKRPASDTVNLSDFGIFPSAGDVAPAIQSVLDYYIGIAENKNSIYGLPRIVFGGGTYQMDSTVNTKPWLSLYAASAVTLDFSNLGTTEHGIICDNFTSVDTEQTLPQSRWTPNLSFLSGASWFIVGPGRDVSTGTGLLLGNFSSGGKWFRGGSVKNAVVTDFGAGHAFGNYDTYLCSVENCRFELCGTPFTTATTDTNSVNSGERMSWRNCTFAGASEGQAHAVVAVPGFDAFFNDCSFDFSAGDVLQIRQNGVYGTINFSNCHFEEWNGLLVNANSLTGSYLVNQSFVTFDQCSILPEPNTNTNEANSPSRALIQGETEVTFTNLKLKYTVRPYLEDGVPISGNTGLRTFSGLGIAPFRGRIYNASILNRDYNFQSDADGTSADSLAFWERAPLAMTDVSTRQIAVVGGKKVLSLVGTSETNSSITFYHRDQFPCQAGVVLGCDMALSLQSATGDTTIQTDIEFYSADGILIQRLPSSSAYGIRSAFNDTELPNYEEGGSRYMSSNANIARAPIGTSYAKLRLVVVRFGGAIHISRARIWRAN